MIKTSTLNLARQKRLLEAAERSTQALKDLGFYKECTVCAGPDSHTTWFKPDSPWVAIVAVRHENEVRFEKRDR